MNLIVASSVLILSLHQEVGCTDPKPFLPYNYESRIFSYRWKDGKLISYNQSVLSKISSDFNMYKNEHFTVDESGKEVLKSYEVGDAT